VYVVSGSGARASGETPEEAARAFLEAGGSGRAMLVRSPAWVTPYNIAEQLGRWHLIEPAATGDDDSWIQVLPDRALWDLGIDWGERPPRMCDGYRAALDAGLVRLPPSAPPTALPGLAATLHAKVLFIGVGVLFLLIVPMSTIGGTPAVMVLAGLLAAWFFGFPRLLERRKWQELDAGYITLPIAESSRGESTAPRWDYRGTWQLTANGEVKAAPDPNLDAPGYYPSPAGIPGRLNLWTGAQWVAEFREYAPALGTSGPQSSARSS